ncbi:MAG: vWA domain-containing protein [Bacteroidales bacterium]
MNIIQFENPQYFWLFAILPLLIFLAWLSVYFRRKNLRKLGTSEMIGQMNPYHSIKRSWLKAVLFLFAFASLIMAMVNPQVGYKTEEVTSSGVDIVIALDVSRSMQAEDIRPNRMERAKLAVSRLIDRLENDRVGLVIFAGTAVTQVPLTHDHEAAKMILRTIDTQSIDFQGTSLSAALERAIAAFSGYETNSKVIILISDGENHDDNPTEVAQRADEQDIIIHTVGVGTPQGAPIPVQRNNQLAGFLRDDEGNTVVSRFDEALLTSLAQQANGNFENSSAPDLGLNNILDQIRSMEQQEYDTKQFSEYESRFHYFIALALLFLLMDVLIFERKNIWLNTIRLFD